jgi:hypothetical protein
MKKIEIIRRVVKELMEREEIELALITARDVQTRAAATHRQSISMPLIYMVLAEMKKRAAVGGTTANSPPESRVPLQPRATTGNDTDLLTAAAAFLRAAGSIENARRTLDQVEQFIAIVRET